LACLITAAAAAGVGDLKPALVKALNDILQPVRDHFVNNKEAAALLKQVKSYKVTR
jgi:tyrosyl-tRNA synthetase